MRGRGRQGKSVRGRGKGSGRIVRGSGRAVVGQQLPRTVELEALEFHGDGDSESYLPKEFDPTYEDVEEEEMEADMEPVEKLTDIHPLQNLEERIQEYQAGGWLRFKHEKEWEHIDGVIPDLFAFDFDGLAAALSAVPIHERIPIPANFVSEARKAQWIADAYEQRKRPETTAQIEMIQKPAPFPSELFIDPATLHISPFLPSFILPLNFEEPQIVPSKPESIFLDLDALAKSMTKVGLLSRLPVPEEYNMLEIDQNVSFVEDPREDVEISKMENVDETQDGEKDVGTTQNDVETLELQDWLDDLLEE